MNNETQQTISLWGLETFGPTPVGSIAARANVEMAELVSGLASSTAGAVSADLPETTRRALLEECADVLIMLYQVTDRLGGDLHAEVDRKMNTNRLRVWGTTATGKKQHVTSFKEPGTGVTMGIGRWYVVSEDGCCYSPAGFETSEDALDWAVGPESGDLTEIPTVVRFEATVGGFGNTSGLMIMLADDLYRFWQLEENIDQFVEFNRV